LLELGKSYIIGHDISNAAGWDPLATDYENLHEEVYCPDGQSMAKGHLFPQVRGDSIWVHCR